MSYLAPSPVGGSSLAPWKLLLSTDQGTAPSDPAGLSMAGTRFDASNGLFTWVMAGDTTQVDGYRENMVRWTKSLSALYPGIASGDIVEVAMPTSIPFGALGTERYGLAFGVLDADASALSALDGTMFGVYAITGATFQTVAYGGTSVSATDAFAGIPDLQVGRFSRMLPLNAQYASCVVRNTLGAAESNTGAPINSAVSTDVPGWYIHVGHSHHSAISAPGLTMTARVWHRRIRTSGLSGLP